MIRPWLEFASESDYTSKDGPGCFIVPTCLKFCMSSGYVENNLLLTSEICSAFRSLGSGDFVWGFFRPYEQLTYPDIRLPQFMQESFTVIVFTKHYPPAHTMQMCVLIIQIIHLMILLQLCMWNLILKDYQSSILFSLPQKICCKTVLW